LVIRKNADDLSDWRDRARRFYTGLGAEFVGHPGVIRFPSGAIIRMGHLKDDQAYTKYQGHEYQRILIEELTQIPDEKRYLQLIGSCRSVHQDIKPQIFTTTNPGGVGHAWVKKRWNIATQKDWGKAFLADDTGRYRIFIPAKIDDNPTLMKNDPGYVKTLEGYKKVDNELYMAWRWGSWDVFSGQVFREFNYARHVTDNFEFHLDQCKKIIAFDWGYNAPGCAVWLAVAPENRFGTNHIYIYREIYQNEKTPEEWGKQIGLFTRIEETDFMVLPHDCFSRDRSGKRTIADVFKKMISTRIVAGNTLAKGARLNRLAAMHDLLADAGDGVPYLRIHPKNENLIRTLPELVYDDVKIEDVDSSSEDHCLSGDTLVLTNKGWIKIEELPFAKITGYDTIVMELITIDGDRLQCTPNHKILTPKGWKQARELKAGESVLSLSLKQYKNLEELDIINAENIIADKQKKHLVQKDCTESFGNLLTAKYQKPITSTTKTGTDQTTESQTLNSLKKQSILLFIPLTQLKNKEKLDEKMHSELVERVISRCLKNKEVKRLKSVGYAGKREKVYDIGINHSAHSFIVNGGFVVHNCYDAASLGLMAISVKYKLSAGAIKGRVLKETEARIKTDPKTGESYTYDFAKEIKEKMKRKSKDWRYI